MKLLRGLGQFWYDFIVGDDWKIVAVVVPILVLGGVLLLGAGASDAVLSIVVSVLLLVGFAGALMVNQHGSSRKS